MWQSSAPRAGWEAPNHFYVIQDCWAPHPGRETISANSSHEFGVRSRQDSRFVQCFPNVVWAFWRHTMPRVAQLRLNRSSFAVHMPPASDAYKAEAGYDLWFTSKAGLWKEVMVWVDSHDMAGGRVPLGSFESWGQRWIVHENPTRQPGHQGEIIVRRASNEAHGTVHLLWIIKHLERIRTVEGAPVILPGDDFHNAGFGFEIASTGGVPRDFTVRSYRFAWHD